MSVTALKKKTSIRWKIGKYLFVFAAGLIGLLFLFQVVLLEPMYQRSKVQSVRIIGNDFARAIDSEKLDDVLFLTMMQNDACVMIRYDSAPVTIQNQSCTAFSDLGNEAINEMIGFARLSRNKSYMMINENSYDALDGSEPLKTIYYTRIVQGNAGNAVILVSSNISPLSATTRTLTVQLMYISGIILISVCFLTFMIYRGIASPLSRINEAAKSLPKGTYQIDPKSNRYREAEELNTTLSEAAADIQKADKAKRDLLSNVSHDLRTPLTMITGYGEMMRDLPGEKTDENLQVIIDESKRLNNLVNDLLDLSRMQENKITLNEAPFDITEMIETEMRKYDVYHYQDNFDIDVHLGDHVTVNGDRKRIEQVFNNFVINAINYSGNSRHIIIREIVSDKNVRIEVQDFGEGIPEDKLNDIWDRYYKVDKKHVRTTQGSGIGLAIAREILDLHHLQYGVQSKVGEGSKFWFIMPVLKS